MVFASNVRSLPEAGAGLHCVPKLSTSIMIFDLGVYNCHYSEIFVYILY